MPKPQKSTVDKWLDVFADWPAADQESALDTCALLHRQTVRREGRKKAEALPGGVQQPLALPQSEVV